MTLPIHECVSSWGRPELADARRGDLYHDERGDDGYVWTGRLGDDRWVWVCKGSPLERMDSVATGLLHYPLLTEWCWCETCGKNFPPARLGDTSVVCPACLSAECNQCVANGDAHEHAPRSCGECDVCGGECRNGLIMLNGLRRCALCLKRMDLQWTASGPKPACDENDKLNNALAAEEDARRVNAKLLTRCEKCGSSGLSRVGTQGVSKCETLCQECARIRAGLVEAPPREALRRPVVCRSRFRGVLWAATSTALAVGGAVALAPETMTVVDVGRSLVVLCGALFGICTWALAHKED